MLARGESQDTKDETDMINGKQPGDAQNVLSASDGVTLRSQLDEVFRKRITSGEWGAHQRIPSERECCAMFNVSRSTVRSVMIQLIGEGLLYRVQGKGTFVSPPPTAMAFQTLGIRDKLDTFLPTSYSVVTKARVEQPPEFIAALFGNPPQTPMFCLERQRFKARNSAVPSIYQYNYLPVKYGQSLDLSALSTGRLTHQLRDKFVLSPARLEEWLEVASATPVESQALMLPPASPVLITDELAFDGTDRPYLFNRFVFPANQLRLSFGSKG